MYGRYGTWLLTVLLAANDISSGSYNFPKVKATFAGAFEILRATLYMKSEILSSRRSGSAVRLRESGYRPEDLGMLSYILDVTQEVSSFRVTCA